ncbi:MAG: SMI1/KNR4 family protein [Lachnospiraceae bacterium]|nr:SMI1/KNR4 family protein [Lachnospiraceae bacterium]MDN4745472.1 SMI1/KNR4 family protein [Lachnospiraceae bacterium C1.1]
MLKKPGGFKSKRLREFTDKIKFKLPKDYSNFLKNSNGMAFGEEYIGFCLKGERNSIYMDELLGIGVYNGSDIERYYDEYADELPEKTIIIGETMETGKLLLKCQDGNTGVYLWDNDFILEQSTEEKCIYKVADSFDEFIGKLHKVA